MVQKSSSHKSLNRVCMQLQKVKWTWNGANLGVTRFAGVRKVVHWESICTQFYGYRLFQNPLKTRTDHHTLPVFNTHADIRQVAVWSSTHFPKQASDCNRWHWACKRQTADVQQPWRVLHQSHKWGCKTLPMVHFSSLGTAGNNQQWWNYLHNGVSSMQQKEKLVMKTTSHGQQTTIHQKCKSSVHWTYGNSLFHRHAACQHLLSSRNLLPFVLIHPSTCWSHTVMDKSEGPWGSLILLHHDDITVAIKLHNPWLLCL